MGRPLACCSIALALMSSVAVAATLTGRAVDEDGQPVTGANVWLCFDHIEAGARPMDVVAATTTGDDGAFSIADPDHEAPLGEREHWWIYAYKPGLALTRVEAVGPAQTHELKLVEPAMLTIRRILVFRKR